MDVNLKFTSTDVWHSPLVGGSQRCRLAAHAASDEDARQAHHGCP